MGEPLDPDAIKARAAKRRPTTTMPDCSSYSLQELADRLRLAARRAREHHCYTVNDGHGERVYLDTLDRAVAAIEELVEAVHSRTALVAELAELRAENERLREREGCAPRGQTLIPFVTTGDDGETAFCDGHVTPPERFVRAMFANAAYDGWDLDLHRLDRTKLVRRVRYTWWRERFPDDEVGEECTEGDVGAIPITVLPSFYECWASDEPEDDAELRATIQRQSSLIGERDTALTHASEALARMSRRDELAQAVVEAVGKFHPATPASHAINWPCSICDALAAYREESGRG